MLLHVVSFAQSKTSKLKKDGKVVRAWRRSLFPIFLLLQAFLVGSIYTAFGELEDRGMGICRFLVPTPQLPAHYGSTVTGIYGNFDLHAWQGKRCCASTFLTIGSRLVTWAGLNSNSLRLRGKEISCSIQIYGIQIFCGIQVSCGR